MATSTAGAAGRPGSASRLIVRVSGSYPGVIQPPASTRAAATSGAASPSAPAGRLNRVGSAVVHLKGAVVRQKHSRPVLGIKPEPDGESAVAAGRGRENVGAGS